MIKINLLPPVEKAPFWQVRYFYITGIIFLLLCLGGSWGYLHYEQWSLTRELQELRQQKELLKPVLAQKQVVDARQQAIFSRQAILIKLTQERPPIYAAVTRLGVIIPDGVWLTDVACVKETLKVSGMAESYPGVAEFLRKVQEDALYTNFSLIMTEQDKNAARFEFTAKFKGM